MVITHCVGTLQHHVGPRFGQKHPGTAPGNVAWKVLGWGGGHYGPTQTWSKWRVVRQGQCSGLGRDLGCWEGGGGVWASPGTSSQVCVTCESLCQPVGDLEGLGGGHYGPSQTWSRWRVVRQGQCSGLGRDLGCWDGGRGVWASPGTDS